MRFNFFSVGFVVRFGQQCVNLLPDELCSFVIQHSTNSSDRIVSSS